MAFRARALVVATAYIGLLLAPLTGMRDLQASVFLVDLGVDTPDADPGDGECATEGGNCSVRAAFEEAAALGGEKHVIVLRDETTHTLSLHTPIEVVGDVVLTRPCTTEIGDVVPCPLDSDVELDRDVSIDGDGATRLLEVTGGSSLRVRGVALRGGVAEPSAACSSGLGAGGAICSAPNASLDLEATLIEGCRASLGGAVAGPVTLHRSIVQGNTALEIGGGLYASGVAVVVEESTVDGNAVRETEGDRPSGKGGGVAIVGGGSLRVLRSAISRNASLEGGGIFLDDPATVRIENSTLSTNEAGATGGGLWIACAACAGSPPVELNNVTIAANVSGGAGTAVATTGAVALARLTNTLVATNVQAFSVEGVAPVECSGPIESGGGNLFVTDRHGCTAGAGDVVVDAVDAVGLGGLGVELLFDDTNDMLAMAPTETHVLLAASPALGAGDVASCAIDDQLGRARQCAPVTAEVEPDVQCDIGASESPADGDGDGVPDCMDWCPGVADPTNARDMGDPARGDVCEDSDQDGVFDPEDDCPVCIDRNHDGTIDLRDGCDGREIEGTLTWVDGCTALDQCPCMGTLPVEDDGRLLRWKSRREWRRCIKRAVRGASVTAERGKRAIKRAIIRSLLADPGLSSIPRCGTRIKIPGIDSDGDGLADEPGLDVDGDGIPDPPDNCPKRFNRRQLDPDGDAKGSICDNDLDGDGTPDRRDNCPRIPNATQFDKDDDGLGDPCDADIDGDGIGNARDNCPRIKNKNQADQDNDGHGDVCSDCTDPDGDGFGSPGFRRGGCEQRGRDNCPDVANEDQLDTDGDGVGDACQSSTTTTTSTTLPS